MKVLFVYPSFNTGYKFGGAMKLIVATLEGMRALGHEVKVLQPAADVKVEQVGDDGKTFLGRLKEWPSAKPESHCKTEQINGIEYYNASTTPHFCSQLLYLMDQYKPDWTIVGGDGTYDTTKMALSKSRRVVWLTLNPAMMPFGKLSYFKPEEHAERLKTVQQLAGIITHGTYMQNHLSQAGIPVEGFNLPGYGPGPFERMGRFDKGGVMIINPSDIKGLPIFLELAKRFPKQEFVAVPTWASLEEDIAAMRALPNVRLVDPHPDVGQVIKHAKILLAPSLWWEAFGMVVVDAMARGVPTMASNVGGLPQAKLGLDYVLPVTQLTDYQRGAQAWTKRGVGENGALRPVAVVPEQNIGPWAEALGKLLTDRKHYEELAERSYLAGKKFVEESNDLSPLMRFLKSLETRLAKSA